MSNINLDTFTCTCPDPAISKDKDLLRRMMEGMMTARKFEEKVFELFGKGMVHGTTHLGIGEEATGIGTGYALKEDDYMLATHRGHGEAIGKGCNIDLMMAEILAKETGLNRGRGGSMHICDYDKGVLGANGILGANAPIGCGAALTAKKKGLDRICLCYFGDGASNEGAIHESMNLATVWSLPIVFVVIHNGYGMSTPTDHVMHELDLNKRAAAYGMKSMECDGNNVLDVYCTVKSAREYAVKNGPVMVIQHTYRTSGHSKSDGNLYRTKDEIAWWKDRMPVLRFKNYLIEKKLFTEAEIDEMDAKTTATIDHAVEFGMNSPEPAVEDVLDGVYAE